MAESTRRVALVTGGAKRVGRAIALELADAGFDVAITYHSSGAEAEDLVRHISDNGRRAAAIAADLTRPGASVESVAAAVEREFGRLDVLVNNASLYLPGDLRSATSEALRRMQAIHVEAPLLLCRRFEPMLRAAGGHVVNMVDLLAERPWPKYLAYATTKAGLWNLTRGLAVSLAPDVTVNGIAPGVVEWPDDFPEEDRRRYLRRVPLGRAGAPEDVARLVRFLVTDGRYITGEIIRLDGGRSVT
jgi:pteridine reductase